MQQVSAQQTLNGPYDDNYLKTDEFGLESTVWSPCGEEGLLNVNSEVRVTPLNTNNSALLTVRHPEHNKIIGSSAVSESILTVSPTGRLD
jgi:hypothetical protein